MRTISTCAVLAGALAMTPAAAGAAIQVRPSSVRVPPGQAQTVAVAFDPVSLEGFGSCAVQARSSASRSYFNLAADGGVVSGGTLRVAVPRRTAPGRYAVDLTCPAEIGSATVTVRVPKPAGARRRRSAVGGSPHLRFTRQTRPYTDAELQTLADRMWADDGAGILAAWTGTGQCTDWATQRRPDVVRRIVEAQYVADRQGRSAPPFGNAATWADAAAAAGLHVEDLPTAGALVVWQPGVEGAGDETGHVGYVESVAADGSTFSTSEMNFGGVFVMGYRTLSSAPVAGRRFIWP